MTRHEAIEVLEEVKMLDDSMFTYSQTYNDALDMAIEVLKEPEPKEVIYDEVHRSVYCPSCDNRLAGLTYNGAVALETEETPNYCWMCGQAVKWDGN